MRGVLQQAEKFIQDNALPPTTFGRRVNKDPRLLLDMRNGRQPREATTKRIIAFIEGYKA